MNHAWTLISITGRRQYGGNLGYTEDPQQTCRYDGDVSNHLRVSVGDLVFVRNRKSVLGMARIEDIRSFTAPKRRNRCPTCATTSIKDRKKKTPLWRCSDGHEFDDPVVDNEEVNAYEADYGNTFLPLDSTFSAQHLKNAAPRPKDQLSIEEIDVVPLAERIVSTGPEARDLLERFLQARCPSPEGYSPSEQPATPDTGNAYTPGMADTRERINRSVAQRRGQKPFRNSLIRRYGPACMVSGCELMEIVEAAHIWP